MGQFYGQIESMENDILLRRTFNDAPPDHPIRLKMSQPGLGSFMELNWLARDLRLAANCSGFREVLEELLHSPKYQSTLHMLRCSGSFLRAKNVVEFIPTADEKRPDFLVRSKVSSVLVEAKWLSGSEHSKTFETWAIRVADDVRKFHSGLPRSLPILNIILKRVDDLPKHEIVMSLVSELICRWPTNKKLITAETPQVRLELLDDNQNSNTPKIYVSINIVCRGHKKETKRVFSKIQSANNQIKDWGDGSIPGVIMLGLNDSISILDIHQTVLSKFNHGQYRKVSNVFYLEYRTTILNGRHAPITLHGSTYNSAFASLPPIELRFEAAGADIFEAKRALPGTRPYNFSVIEFSYREPSPDASQSGIMAFLPSFERLPAEWAYAA